jgi:hypothetical protein
MSSLGPLKIGSCFFTIPKYPLKEFGMPLDPTIPHTDITYRIIGCAMRVHTRLGPGLDVGAMHSPNLDA